MILKFSQKCFWDSWILVYCWFDSYFMFIAKEKLHFSLICNFYCCLVKGGWALKVAYKLVAYKKTKCSKSITGLSISRLGNVEDFFSINIFFKCKYMRINDYSLNYLCAVCSLKIRFYSLTFSTMSSNMNSAYFTTPVIRGFNSWNRDAAGVPKYDEYWNDGF